MDGPWLIQDHLLSVLIQDIWKSNLAYHVPSQVFQMTDRCSLRNSEPGIRNPEFGIGVF